MEGLVRNPNLTNDIHAVFVSCLRFNPLLYNFSSAKQATNDLDKKNTISTTTCFFLRSLEGVQQFKQCKRHFRFN